jgi:hypothetical protein
MRLRNDGVTHDLLKKEYVSLLGNAEEFKKYVFECAVRNGYGEYKSTVVISDGATWIRDMCDEIFPGAVQILDFFHLKENITASGNIFLRTRLLNMIRGLKVLRGATGAFSLALS